MTEPTLLGNEKYEVRVTRLTILPPSEPIFSERATHIELRDETAGVVVVTQDVGRNDKVGSIDIDCGDEWLAIRGAVDYMMGQCEIHSQD